MLQTVFYNNDRVKTTGRGRIQRPKRVEKFASKKYTHDGTTLKKFEKV